jgi:hypothetical protein
MDERRLLLEVNTQGIVQAILSTSTPGSLFGFEPHQLMGKSLGNVVDVLHLQGGSSKHKNANRTQAVDRQTPVIYAYHMTWTALTLHAYHRQRCRRS